MDRRRVSFRESWNKATDGPAGDDSGGYASMIAAVWYWIAGEPIPDENLGEGDESAP